MEEKRGRHKIELKGRKFEKVLELYSREKISMTDAAYILGIATGTFKRMVEDRIVEEKRGDINDEESKDE